MIKIDTIGLVSIPAEKYHAHPAVGHSGLVRIMRSPAHFRAWLEAPPEPTQAMLLGTAFHTALLEPDRFSQTHVVAPKFDRRTKEGKAAAEAWEAENAGKTALTVDQMSAIEKMVASVHSHAGAASLLACGMAEMSAFWIDQETGIECKCRPDWFQVDGGVQHIAEVKTCCDATYESFARSIAINGYDVQAALYVDGIQAVTRCKASFFFIAVEKEPPYAVAVYKPSDELIEVGRAKYRGALEMLQWCLTNDSWPGYQPHGQIEEIDLPRWAANFDLEG